MVFCKHYSLYGIEFDPADQVIEIHVHPDNLYKTVISASENLILYEIDNKSS